MQVILHHHLGLGDHFICNGLVHSLGNRFSKIHLVCWNHNLTTVKSLYQDHTNIVIHGVSNESQGVSDLMHALKLPVLRVGFHNCDAQDFEASFYRQLNLDTDMQYTGFCFPQDQTRSKEMYQRWVDQVGNDYIFVHDASSRQKFTLSIASELPRYTVERSQTPNVLDYIWLIRGAREIHILNSSIQALVWPMLRQGLIGDAIIYYHDIEQHVCPIRVPQQANVCHIKYY